MQSYHSVVLKGYANGADGKVGFCYSATDKDPNPVSCLYVETTSIQADNSYELTVDDLLPRTKYYYRAFATKDSKTVLAKEVKTFVTENFKPDAVDLGLSVKWANCNVGATAPEQYGDYFVWGETEPYYSDGHSQDNPCKNWKSGKSEGYEWPSYKWCNGSYNTRTKYCSSADLGTVDNKTVLDPEDDAATANWGGFWRMPNIDELKELQNNCTWKFTSINGVNGYKVTGMNGNSIFLPAAGRRIGSSISGVGSSGSFWSSMLNTSNSSNAYYFNFSGGDIDYSNDNCILGMSVRPVCE